MSRQPTASHADRGLEWFSALAMLGWAYVLVQPGDILANGNLKEFLRFGATETQIAMVFGVVGMGRLVALYINGRWPRSPTLRMVGAAIGLMVWGQVAIALIQAVGMATTGLAVYGPLALSEILSIRRAAFDARYHRQ
jgi:hypothetical protein